MLRSLVGSEMCIRDSLLGLNHERLTYFHDGRDFRLTDVSGQVVNGVLA